MRNDVASEACAGNRPEIDGVVHIVGEGFAVGGKRSFVAACADAIVIGKSGDVGGRKAVFSSHGLAFHPFAEICRRTGGQSYVKARHHVVRSKFEGAFGVVGKTVVVNADVSCPVNAAYGNAIGAVGDARHIEIAVDAAFDRYVFAGIDFGKRKNFGPRFAFLAFDFVGIGNFGLSRFFVFGKLPQNADTVAHVLRVGVAGFCVVNGVFDDHVRDFRSVNVHAADVDVHERFQIAVVGHGNLIVPRFRNGHFDGNTSVKLARLGRVEISKRSRFDVAPAEAVFFVNVNGVGVASDRHAERFDAAEIVVNYEAYGFGFLLLLGEEHVGFSVVLGACRVVMAKHSADVALIVCRVNVSISGKAVGGIEIFFNHRLHRGIIDVVSIADHTFDVRNEVYAVCRPDVCAGSVETIRRIPRSYGRRVAVVDDEKFHHEVFGFEAGLAFFLFENGAFFDVFETADFHVDDKIVKRRIHVGPIGGFGTGICRAVAGAHYPFCVSALCRCRGRIVRSNSIAAHRNAHARILGFFARNLIVVRESRLHRSVSDAPKFFRKRHISVDGGRHSCRKITGAGAYAKVVGLNIYGWIFTAGICQSSAVKPVAVGVVKTCRQRKRIKIAGLAVDDVRDARRKPCGRKRVATSRRGARSRLRNRQTHAKHACNYCRHNSQQRSCGFSGFC